MYSQLVDHLTVIHRVTINTMPYCHKDRRRVHPVRVRAYVLSPKAHRVPRVIPTARRLHMRLTHVRCTRFTLSTVHCVRRLLYTPPNVSSYLGVLTQMFVVPASRSQPCIVYVVCCTRRQTYHRILASSLKYGECNCSCRHTRQFAVTLSARVAAERTSIVIVDRRLYS